MYLLQSAHDVVRDKASFLNSSNASQTASSQTQPSTQRSAAGNTSVDLGLGGYGSQSQSQSELPISGQVPHTQSSSYSNISSSAPELSADVTTFAALDAAEESGKPLALPTSPHVDEILRGTARILEDSQSETDRGTTRRGRRGSATPQTTPSSQRRSTRIGASRQSSVEPASQSTGQSASKKRGRSHDVDTAPKAKRSAASKQLAPIVEQEATASQDDLPFEPLETSTQFQPSQYLAEFRPPSESWKPMSQMPVEPYVDDSASQAMDLGTQDVDSLLASDRYDGNAGYGQQV